MTSNGTPLQAFKRAQADTNTRKIAEVITALQRSGQPINVSSVARATGLDRNTVRRRIDLYHEIKHQHLEQVKRPPLTHATTRDASSYKDLEAKWKTAMAEIKTLRKENQTLRQQLHQDLSGVRPGQQPPLEEAQAEASRLAVKLVNLQRELRELADNYRDLSIEANEAHGLNRDYVRWTNRLPVQIRDRYPFDHVGST